jgi:hypothetical protein
MGFPSGHHLLEHWKIDLFHEVKIRMEADHNIPPALTKGAHESISQQQLGICN